MGDMTDSWEIIFLLGRILAPIYLGERIVGSYLFLSISWSITLMARSNWVS